MSCSSPTVPRSQSTFPSMPCSQCPVPHACKSRAGWQNLRDITKCVVLQSTRRPFGTCSLHVWLAQTPLQASFPPALMAAPQHPSLVPKCLCVTALLCVALSVCFPPSSQEHSSPHRLTHCPVPAVLAGSLLDMLSGHALAAATAATSLLRRGMEEPVCPPPLPAADRAIRKAQKPGWCPHEPAAGSAAVPWGASDSSGDGMVLPRSPPRGYMSPCCFRLLRPELLWFLLSAVVCCDACPPPAPAPGVPCQPAIRLSLSCSTGAGVVLCSLGPVPVPSGVGQVFQEKPHLEPSLLCFGNGRKCP